MTQLIQTFLFKYETFAHDLVDIHGTEFYVLLDVIRLRYKYRTKPYSLRYPATDLVASVPLAKHDATCCYELCGFQTTLKKL